MKAGSIRRGVIGLLAMVSFQVGASESPRDPRTLIPPAPASRAHKATLPRRVANPSQSVEPSGAVVSSAVPTLVTGSPFAPKVAPTAASTSLVPPLTVNYAGSLPVLLIQNTGANKGVESVTSNANNQTSALYGETNGSGAGVNGVNTGLTGPAGKFQLRNTRSDQPAIVASSAGTGNAIYAEISNENNDMGSAIFAQSGSLADTPNPAIVGSGLSNASGVAGYSYAGSAVVGIGTYGVGVFATTYGGAAAVYAQSDAAYALEAASTEVTAIMASSDEGVTINAHSTYNGAIYGASELGPYGIWGQAANAVGVMGKDTGSGYGIYGTSASGYAGYFEGPVNIVGTLTVNGVQISSDRNLKSHFNDVDTRDVLERIRALPITSWGYKTSPEIRHMGPMAQDFHAAFGLDGDDDKHINLTDMAGVSLAAIQELSKQLAEKNRRIAALEAQNAEFGREFAEMRAALMELKTSDQRLATQ